MVNSLRVQASDRMSRFEGKKCRVIASDAHFSHKTYSTAGILMTHVSEKVSNLSVSPIDCQ